MYSLQRDAVMWRYIFVISLIVVQLIAPSAASVAQTVRWDFDSDNPGSLPMGWVNQWNIGEFVLPTCIDTSGNQNCDYQNLTWGVIDGQLRAPIYEDLDGEVGKGEIVDVAEVTSNLKKGKSYMTIHNSSSENWKRGEKNA